MSQQPINPSPGSGARRGDAPDGNETTDFARDKGRQVATDAREQGRQVADHARQEGREVADHARQEAGGVADTARGEVARVADEAKVQTRNLLHQAQDEVHTQARGQTQRLAGGARSVADQLHALSEGRVDEAGPVADYARQATRQVQQFADRLDQRGFDGVVDDVQRFARRRPGAFLLGAAAAGFVAGRFLRGARDAGDQGNGSGYQGQYRSSQYGAPQYGGGQYRTPTGAPSSSLNPDDLAETSRARPEAVRSPGSMTGGEARMPGTTAPVSQPGSYDDSLTGSGRGREER